MERVLARAMVELRVRTFSWNWCGVGMNLVWSWYEIGMELVWNWCGIGVGAMGGAMSGAMGGAMGGAMEWCQCTTGNK